MTLRSVIRGYAFSSHSEKPGILKLFFFFFGGVWSVWHLKLRLRRPMVINKKV